MGKFSLNSKSTKMEIVRFLITGVICTLIDFIVVSLVSGIIPSITINIYLKNAIATLIGFSVSVIVNYFLSAFWVYQNVDKNVNKKGAKEILLFILFALIGLLIGIGVVELFVLIDSHTLNLNFQSWLEFLFNKEYSFNFLQFLFGGLYFAIKTLIVLTWNYLSRKFFIFKPAK